MSKTTNSRLSELMTIRDILMGEIISEYNDRFESLEKELSLQKKMLEDKEKELDQRITTLDELLEGKSQKLHQLISDKTEADRKALGAMLLSVGQQLREE